MKYIMFEIDFAGCKQRLPVIFPNNLIHADVAKWMHIMMKRVHRWDARVISAGDYNAVNGHVSGSSDTLRISHDPDDTETIATHDYLHGIV